MNIFLKFTCALCEQPICTDRGQAGARVGCPRCDHPMIVPKPPEMGLDEEPNSFPRRPVG